MGSGKRIFVEQVVGSLVEVLHATGQAVVEEAEIETDIQHLLFLPAQFGIGKALMAKTRVVAVLIVAGSHPETQGLVAAQAGVVAGGTIADAQLQVADPAQVADEVFLCHTPGSANAVEVTPLVVGAEDGRTVTTERTGEEILLSIVVFGMAEERHQGGVGIIRRHALQGTCAGELRHEVEGEIGGRAGEIVAMALPELVTGHGRHAVLAEGTVEVERGGAGEHQVRSLGLGAAATVGRTVTVILVPVAGVIDRNVVG